MKNYRIQPEKRHREEEHCHNYQKLLNYEKIDFSTLKKFSRLQRKNQNTRIRAGRERKKKSTSIRIGLKKKNFERTKRISPNDRRFS